MNDVLKLVILIISTLVSSAVLLFLSPIFGYLFSNQESANDEDRKYLLILYSIIAGITLLTLLISAIKLTNKKVYVIFLVLAAISSAIVISILATSNLNYTTPIKYLVISSLLFNVFLLSFTTNLLIVGDDIIRNLFDSNNEQAPPINPMHFIPPPPLAAMFAPNSTKPRKPMAPKPRR